MARLWHGGPNIFWLLLLALPVLWPLYKVGLPQTADGLSHMLRLVSMDNLIHSGMWYPRWMPQLVGGYGSPLLNFYAPGTYYLAEAFRWAGASYVNAISLAYVMMILAGGIGMYRLAADIFAPAATALEARWPALVAAVAYVYAPYLMVNVYFRGALGETGAQALLPWILWSFRRVLWAEKPGRYVLAASLSLAGLAVAHNITLFYFSPLLLVYLALAWWQTGRSRWRLAWLATAGAAAMGLSAFFWLPMIGERSLINDRSFSTAQEWMRIYFSTRPAFLDTSLTLGYRDFSTQLRLGQIILAGIGFAVARTRRAEWWCFGGGVVLLCLAIFRISEPIWLAWPILAIIQFPWRMLAVVNLLLALFTAGSVSWFVSRRWQAVSAAALIMIIFLTQTPRTDRLQVMVPNPAPLNAAVIAQYEQDTGALGMSPSPDFLLRWMDLTTSPFNRIVAAAAPPPSPNAVGLAAANLYARDITIDTSVSTTLTLADSYYPAWRAVTSAGQALNTYPTTNLGLLTIDVPPGTHLIHVFWDLSPLQGWGTLISLLALAGLVVLLGWQRRRWGAMAMSAVLAVAVLATLTRRPPALPLQTPATPYRAAGLELLGLQVQAAPAARLFIYPYWFVRSAPPDVQFHWVLLDANGQTVAETLSRPQFQTQNTHNWLAGMLVDDAYQMLLPPQMPAGEYRLALAAGAEAAPVAAADMPVMATIHLTGTPALAALPAPLFRLGPAVTLNGFTLDVNRKSIADLASRPVIRPGDQVVYGLDWAAAQQLQENYHGFFHLLNGEQAATLKIDQLAGSWLDPPLLWDAHTLHLDTYNLVVPGDLPSGLYYPLVGLYSPRTHVGLPALSVAGQDLQSGIVLPALKVLNSASQAPRHDVGARVGDFAELWGYDLTLPASGLRRGSAFDLTLYYRCLAPTASDYIQFIHLYDPVGNHLAAQLDASPQHGDNPTSAWVPGEVIVDRVSLTVSADAPAGVYALRLGLYGSDDKIRLPVADAQRNRLPNGEIDLAQLPIQP